MISSEQFYFVTHDGVLVEIPSVLADSVGIELVGTTPQEAYHLRHNALVNEYKQLSKSIEQIEAYIDTVKDKISIYSKK